MSKVAHKFLPKQTALNKVIKHKERKILKSIHLSMTIKERQAKYLTSPSFKTYIHIQC